MSDTDTVGPGGTQKMPSDDEPDDSETAAEATESPTGRPDDAHSGVQLSPPFPGFTPNGSAMNTPVSRPTSPIVETGANAAAAVLTAPVVAMEDDSEEEDDTHLAIPEHLVGANTPVARGRAPRSQIWQTVKRLKTGHPLRDAGSHTHVCTDRIDDAEDGSERFCNQMLKLPTNQKMGWITSKAVDHMKVVAAFCRPTYRATPLNCVVQVEHTDSKIGREADDRQKGSHDQKVDVLSKTESQLFMLTKREKSLAAQAKWYIYAQMHVSKRAFEDE